MGRLTVYDSEGNEYGQTRRGHSNERISDFFFAGVKVAIDVSGRPELIVFFRARESNTGRSEQFYAVYEENSTNKLFDNFTSDLERWVRQQEMTLVTDMDDVEVYRKLTDPASDLPGNETKHTILKHILQRGESARVGVTDVTGALAMFRHYLEERSADRIAIADESGGSTLDKYELVVETGRYRGIDPLGDTKQQFQRAKSEVEDQIIADRITDIQSTVQNLQQTTSASDAKIRRKLKSQLRILDSPSRNTRNKSGDLRGNDSFLDGRLKIAAAASLVLVAVVVAVVVATMFGPLSLGMIGLGDDGGSAGLLTISTEQQDHAVLVNGTTNASEVSVEIFRDGSSVSSLETVTVNNESFEVTVTPSSTGNLTVTVIPDGEKARSVNESLNYRSVTWVSDLNATQRNESLIVDGASNASEVDVEVLNGGTSVGSEDSVAVDNETFEVELEPSESGNLTVKVSPYGQTAGEANTTVRYEADGNTGENERIAIEPTARLEWPSRVSVG